MDLALEVTGTSVCHLHATWWMSFHRFECQSLAIYQIQKCYMQPLINQTSSSVHACVRLVTYSTYPHMYHNILWEIVSMKMPVIMMPNYRPIGWSGNMGESWPAKVEHILLILLASRAQMHILSSSRWSLDCLCSLQTIAYDRCTTWLSTSEQYQLTWAITTYPSRADRETFMTGFQRMKV